MTGRPDRVYSVSRELQAGCFDCYGPDARWVGPNAQGLAVRHHDAKGHATWCDIVMSIRYGEITLDQAAAP